MPNNRGTVEDTTFVPPTRITSLADRVVRIVGGLGFFWATVALFALASLWIALSVKNDLLFDEGYHMGIIRLMADQGTPFVVQPADQAWLGDLTRFGSYLYHYALSFPLRVAVAAGIDPTGQIIVLRCISVALATAAFWWFRHALLLAGVSAPITHLALFVYAAMPLTSFVAATVNYDNLLILIAAMFFAVLMRMLSRPHTRWEDLAALVVLGAAACLTKFTFLPVLLVAGVLAIGYLVVRHRRSTWTVSRPRWGFTTGRAWKIAVVVVALVVALVLFAERYVVSFILYRTPQPECEAVQTDAFCRNYAPWRRNEEFDASAPDASASIGSLLFYLARGWAPELVKTFTTVGWTGGSSQATPLTAALAVLATVLVVVLAAIAVPRVLRSPGLTIVAAAMLAYAAVLILRNYSEYLRFNVVVAVSGRYITPFVPFLVAAAGLGLGTLLSRFRRARRPLLALAAILVVLASTQGGFAGTFLVVADDSWFSPTSPLAGLTPVLRAAARFVVLG